MEKLINLLHNLGLTDTEAKIYLAGLDYVSIGVGELEKQTQIKRTTVYHALGTLMQKGLTAKVGTGTKFKFTMSAPENINTLLEKKINDLRNKKKSLEEIIPLLDRQIKKKEMDTKISHFEGIEGIKLVIEEALYCRSHHWDIIAPAKNFFSEFDKDYAEYYLRARKSNQVTARSLWEYALPKRVLTPEEIRERSPRYLPQNMHGKFKSVVIIFDDKIALISSLKEMSAVLIQSKEFHDTFAAIFEGLWEISKDYEKGLKKSRKKSSP